MLTYADGRGVQSVGCVKSVNLDAKTVEVVVVQGHEMLLSHTTPQIGQLVRLATGYAGARTFVIFLPALSYYAADRSAGETRGRACRCVYVVECV